MMKNMANYNFLERALETLLALTIMHASAQFPLEFTQNGPGAGFWPFALGLALLVCAVVLFLYTMMNRAQLAEQIVELGKPGNKRVYIMMVLAVLYCALLTVIGFYPASAALIVAIMHLMDYKKPKGIALTTFGTLVFIYLVFGMLLRTQMPMGMFFD